MTYEFVGEAEARFVEHAVPGQHDGIVERAAPDKVRPTQGLDLFDEAEGSRRSNVASERAILENDATMLDSDHWMCEVDQAINFISVCRFKADTSITRFD